MKFSTVIASLAAFVATTGQALAEVNCGIGSLPACQVPEPATGWLLAVAAVGAVIAARKVRK